MIFQRSEGGAWGEESRSRIAIRANREASSVGSRAIKGDVAGELFDSECGAVCPPAFGFSYTEERVSMHTGGESRG